jgi:hypothetical protein
MNVFERREIRERLRAAFPKFFVNSLFEIIIYPARNSYFALEGIETEEELNAKVLEWLSREASKSVSRVSQKYHLNGINAFLGTDFSQEDMTEIYTYLGNRCNHEKTLRFIRSGYDMSALAKEAPNE